MGDIAVLPVARPILAAHDMLGQNRLKRADDLQLLVAQRVGLKARGRLHRGKAQKLHQVVLHGFLAKIMVDTVDLPLAKPG